MIGKEREKSLQSYSSAEHSFAFLPSHLPCPSSFWLRLAALCFLPAPQACPAIALATAEASRRRRVPFCGHVIVFNPAASPVKVRLFPVFPVFRGLLPFPYWHGS
jgi:hypothetical protein